MSNKELKVKRIKNGTVIDHITSNRALNILNMLGLPDDETAIMIAINVNSSDMNRKDIIKIEGRELSQEEVDKLVLLAPKATLNIIRDYKNIRKSNLHLMDEITDVVTCTNPNCITNSNEPIQNKFKVQSKEPILLRCEYCERTMDYEDIESQF